MIYGVKVFTPIMIAQTTECHIVNVGSVAGLLAGPGLAIYNILTHPELNDAIRTRTENIVRQRNPRVG